MSPTAQFATTHDVLIAEFSGNDSIRSAGDDVVRYAKNAIDLALAHKDAALTTGERKRDAQSKFLPDSVSQEQANQGFSRILDFPQPSVPEQATVSFHAIQEWEGYIIEIGDTDFVARLIDLTASATHEEEEALIPLTEISDDDAADMKLGSIFRWVIGYERSAAGTKKRVSQFVFRDLPVVTRSDLRDGESWAREITRSLDL